MERVAIIPARSGSKGLKNKNIIDICGKPLMAYSIQAARKSNMFSRIIVSTDSVKYGEIAREYGSEVMLRDAELSNDDTSTFAVVENLLNKLEKMPDCFVLLQPTSPLRNENHICEAIKLFEDKMEEFDFCVSVCTAKHASLLVNPLGENGSLEHFKMNFSNYQRQQYKEYCPNGAIFIAKPKAYLINKHFFGPRSLAYKMKKEDSVDIDDIWDYEYANFCMKKRIHLLEEQ